MSRFDNLFGSLVLCMLHNDETDQMAETQNQSGWPFVSKTSCTFLHEGAVFHHAFQALTQQDLSPVWPHTFVSPSAFSRRAVVSYWRKYVHEVLVNRLGGLSLPRKSVVRLTDRPDMTLDVYRGRKTTNQQQQQDLSQGQDSLPVSILPIT